MKKILCLLATLALLPVYGEDKNSNGDATDSSRNLTPTAERPPNMANPPKPGWLPQRHGK
ncbi:MAG: hypothetical protein EBT30_05790 [Verrucomicrobia bacterium]|nr:hypothetical protein [Verrucomicrobiota bacterium]